MHPSRLLPAAGGGYGGACEVLDVAGGAVQGSARGCANASGLWTGEERTVSDESLDPAFIRHLTLGVSASDSPDLARLGLPATHVREVLGEIADVVLAGGGKLAYGGHLDPEGYTPFLVARSRDAGRRDRPLLVCLPWSEHRRMRLTELRERSDLGPFGEVVCLDADGTPVDPAIGRGEEAVAEDDPQVRRRSLTSMRRYLVDRTGARVVVGGKRHGFSGALPGLVEESLIALEAGRPLYLAAGCGGATADIARALGVDDSAWTAGLDDAGMDDPILREGCARLEAFAGSAAWSGLNNGLTSDENSLLARSRQPGEIAGLVRRGLGRLATATRHDR